MKIHTVQVVVILFASLGLVCGCFPESTDWRSQYAAWKGRTLEQVARLSDEQIVRRYRPLREQAIADISSRFVVSNEATVLLYGDWSADRIRHVNESVLSRYSFKDGLHVLTIAEASRFLPYGWMNHPLLVDLLKRIVVCRFIPFFPSFYFSVVFKAFGDFSEARIKDLARIADGEWKHCPVSLRDLCSNLSRDHMDAQLESFFRSIMMKRARAMLQTDNERLIKIFFGNFYYVRVEYLREMMLTHWTQRTATIEELTHLLSRKLLRKPGFQDLLQAFRLKTFLVQRIAAFSAHWLDLLNRPPTPSATLFSWKLCFLGEASFHEILRRYVQVRRHYDTVLSMSSVEDRLEYLNGLTPEQAQVNDQEIAQAIEVFKQEMPEI